MTLSVNGQEITEDEIRQELVRLVTFYSGHMSADQIREQLDVLVRRARDQVIGSRLLMQEAENLDFRIPPEDVDRQIESMIAGAGSRDAFIALLSERGIGEKDLRRTIERGQRVDRLVQRITESAPEPSEEEMLKHFSEHAAEYCASAGGEVDFEDVRDTIRDFLRHVYRGRVLEAHVAELKKDADIVDD